MYSFIVIDIAWRRETIKISALDDQDATRLGELYFESDVALRFLEITTPDGIPLTAFVRNESSAEQG